MKRRVSLIGIGLAIILIPTFIMLSFYFSNRDVPVEIRQAEKLVLTTPDQKNVTAVENGKNKDLLALFCDMTLDAKSVEKLSDELKESTPYLAKFSTSQSSIVYRFYFMENPAYCYFVAPDKSVHRIATEKAERFLNTDYSEWVYTYAKSPTVQIDGKEMTPVRLDWEYRRLNGTYQKATCSVENQEVLPVSLGVLSGGGLVIDCTPTPDRITLQAVDSEGKTIFAGTPEQFGTFSVDENVDFTITATVEWIKDAKGTSPFAGKAEFILTASMYPPAEFFVSKTEVRPGEVFTLSGIHVTDPSTIAVEILPNVDFTPHFVEKEGNVKALMTLGFPASYISDSEYQIKVNCPDLPSEVVFTVTVKKQNYATFHDYVKKDVVEDTYSLKNQNLFAELAKEILAMPGEYDSEMEKLTFGEGVLSADTSRYYDYGTDVQIMATGGQYRALDKMYCIYSASRPTAVADGKVLFVGEAALTGKLIVIDHGNGLRSWYCNLKEVTVSPGDTLKKGDIIGTCGGLGFNGQGGLNMHVALSLHNQAINLDIAIEDGIEY